MGGIGNIYFSSSFRSVFHRLFFHLQPPLLDPVRKSVISRNPGTPTTGLLRTNTGVGGYSGGAVMLPSPLPLPLPIGGDAYGERSSVLRGGGGPFMGSHGQEFMPIVIPGSPPAAQQDFFYR